MTPTTLTILIASTFAQWQNANFSAGELSDPNLSGPNGDAVGGGIANLLRYALGIGAHQRGQAGLPVVSLPSYSGTKYLTLTYVRDQFAAGVTCTVQVSAGLNGSWNTGGASLIEVSRTDNGNGTETVVTRDNVPATGSAHRFLRLQVTSP